MKMMQSLIMLISYAIIGSAQGSSPADELARSERHFSAVSDTFGINVAFLRFLANDCVMFNPHPVNGKELYRTRKESGVNLTWYPTFVEVSRSGDFGISTGPWEIRKTKADTAVAFGHYFSVWSKQQDGSWKVIFDNGIGYSKEAKKKEREYFGMVPVLGAPVPFRQAATSALLYKEKEFSQQVKSAGTSKAYEKFAASNFRVYRNNRFPVTERTSGLQLLASLPKQKEYFPIDGKIASSGDLGFTYGYTRTAVKDSGSFMRVWRYDNGWKIAVDMLESYKQQE